MLCKGDLREFHAGLFGWRPDEGRGTVSGFRVDRRGRTNESVPVREHP